jgi:hypothetical protein
MLHSPETQTAGGRGQRPMRGQTSKTAGQENHATNGLGTRTVLPPLCRNKKCGHPIDCHWAFEFECIYSGCRCRKYIAPSTEGAP